MGMDIYGLNPKSETGHYFRNNVWYWRPLWDYCCQVHPNLVGDDPDLGHYNDGYSLDEEKATELANALLADIENGFLARSESEFRQTVAELPMEPCHCCDGTGIRTDEIGQSRGWTEKELEPHVAIIVGRTHGSCNYCHGLGEVENMFAAYEFRADNVERFARFLLDSGGFQIY